MKHMIDKLFTNGAASFHDVLVEVDSSRGYTDEELRYVFDQLPPSIQFIALEWGLSDTVFCDAACVYIRDHKIVQPGEHVIKSSR